MIEIDPKYFMPLSDARQRALIGYMMIDKQVFMLVQEHIKPEHFSAPVARAAYKTLLDYYEKYNLYPDVTNILDKKEYFAVEFVDPQFRASVIAFLTQAALDAPQTHRQPLLQDLDQWVKVVIFQQGIPDSITTFNQHRFDQCYKGLKSVVDNILAVNLVSDGTVRWEDFENVVKGRVNLHNDLLTFGLNGMDRCLIEPPEERIKLVTDTEPKLPKMLETLTKMYNQGVDPEPMHALMQKGFFGSLRKGDTTILLAPTNVGKTTTLITVALSNVLLGRDVLFLSHEGVCDDLQMKMVRALLGVTENQVMAAYLSGDEEKLAPFRFAQKLLARHLTYQSVQVAGNSVENVAARIQRLNEKRMAEYGKGYDLLVDDYPANLTTEEAKGGHLSRRERDDRVYGTFVDLAGQLNLHALLAIQTNREGSRKNKEGDDEETSIIEVEDVAESFGTMMRATNVISINRPPAAEKKNWLIYNVAKTRSSEKGWRILAKSDFANGRAHWWSEFSIWGKGNVTSSAHIEMMLKMNDANGQRCDFSPTYGHTNIKG